MGLAGAAAGLCARALVPSAFTSLPLWLTAVVVAGVPFALIWLFVTAIALAIDRYEAFVLPPALQSVLVLALAVPGAALFGLEGALIGMTAPSVLVGLGSELWARARIRKSTGVSFEGPLRHAISFGSRATPVTRSSWSTTASTSSRWRRWRLRPSSAVTPSRLP